MKKLFKFGVSFVLIVMLVASVITLNVSAATVTVSGGTFEVGDNVTVTIRYNGDKALEGVQLSVSYDTKVLEYKSVSGVDNDGNSIGVNNGKVSFVDENFNGTSQSGSYRITFKAIAAGSSTITVNAEGSDTISDEFKDGKPITGFSTVTVTEPKPSSNADLSSIRLSSGALSPAFNSKTAEYDVTVKYGVESITITGAVADGKSTYIGGGTFALGVGENTRTLTVTAEDGTKKSYTLNIKRMTEEETLIAEEEARNSNPTLVIIDGVDYTIETDLSEITIPAGFSEGTVTRKETEIPVLIDEHGEYTLYWLTDANGENGAFYTSDENDNFTRVNYINANGKMYIIEDLDMVGRLPSKYVKAVREINGAEAMVYNFTDNAFADFCIVKCYVGGTRGYYSYDTVEGTMQRAVEFDINGQPTDSQDVVESNSGVQNSGEQETSWFASMSKTGKMVLLIIVVAALLFIAIAILLIVKISSSKNDEDGYVLDTNNDFVFGDSEEEIAQLPTELEVEENNDAGDVAETDNSEE